MVLKILLGIFALFLFGIILYLSIIQIKENHSQSDPVLVDLKRTLRPILEENNIRVEFFTGKKSYTINKYKVFLCMKDKDGKYYDKNMLMYVALHELAHVICDEVGHTEKFEKIFEKLLKRATDLKIFNPSLPIIDNYCNYD